MNVLHTKQSGTEESSLTSLVFYCNEEMLSPDLRTITIQLNLTKSLEVIAQGRQREVDMGKCRNNSTKDEGLQAEFVIRGKSQPKFQTKM